LRGLIGEVGRGAGADAGGVVGVGSGAEVGGVRAGRGAGAAVERGRIADSALFIAQNAGVVGGEAVSGRAGRAASGVAEPVVGDAGCTLGGARSIAEQAGGVALLIDDDELPDSPFV
jgi:hypothetical protein